MSKATWRVRYAVLSQDGFTSKSGRVWRSFKSVRTFRRATNIARSIGSGTVVEQRFNAGPLKGMSRDWVVA